MAPETILLTFCNQRASPFHSLCVMNLEERHVSWIDLGRIPEEVTGTGEFGGFCGACHVGEYVAVCTQSSKTVLAINDIAGRRQSHEQRSRTLAR